MAQRNSQIGAKLSLDTKGWTSGWSLAQKSMQDATSQGLKEAIKLKNVVEEMDRSRGKLAKSLTLKPGFLGDSSPMHALARPEAARADAAIRRITDSTSRAGQAMQQAQGKSSRFSMGLLQLGYVADDAQYGMRGIMNNIAPLVMGMGMGAGVAGVLQILGTVLQQTVIFWDDFTGATKRAEKATKMAAVETKHLASATKEAGEAGAKQLLYEQRQRERRDAEGGANDRRLSGAERLRQLENDAAKAEMVTPRAHLRTDSQNAQLELERVKKENEMDRAADSDSGAARLVEARRKLEKEKAQLARLNPQVREGEPRLEALRAEKETRDDALEDIAAQVEKNRKKGGFHADMENTKLFRRRAELQADNEEQAGLEASMPGMRAERDKLENSSLPSEITALEQSLGPEAKARERMRQAKETAAQVDAEKAAFEEAGNLVSGAMKQVGREFLLLGGVFQMGMEKARAEHASNNRKRDLLISETRSPRRRAKLQRAADLADETKRLMAEDPKLSEGEAADEAERGIRVKERASGKRTIRSEGPSRAYEGLDGFKRARSNLDYGDKPLPGEADKDAAKERGKRALERAKASLGQKDPFVKDANGGVFQDMLERLDRLIEAVGKSPADKRRATSPR